MADRARFDLFNDQRLIPPGIKDERAEAILAAFAHGAARFDFGTLLMRRSDEIPDEALPLAVHERSLDEYIPSYGLPARVVRNLVDGSFDVHARQGTDGGMEFGLELIGVRGRLSHWWQQSPEGQPNTHIVTVYANEHIFADEPVFLNARLQGAALSMVDATKRWSQDTSFRLGAGFDDLVLAANRTAAMQVARPAITAGPDTSRRNTITAGNRTAAMQVARRTIQARRDTARRNTVLATNQTTAMQIMRATFAA